MADWLAGWLGCLYACCACVSQFCFDIEHGLFHFSLMLLLESEGQCDRITERALELDRTRVAVLKNKQTNKQQWGEDAAEKNHGQ